MMFDVCPTCGGSGSIRGGDWRKMDGTFYGDTANTPQWRPCEDCVGGRVVSESVIEEMAEALWEADAPEDHLNPWSTCPEYHKDNWRRMAHAAARVVLEHIEKEAGCDESN